MKTCRNCKIEKEATEFYKYPKNRDGLHSYCKACVAARRDAWKAANPEKVLAQAQRYAERHPDRLRARQKRYRDANPDRVAGWKRTYYEANRDEILAAQKLDRRVNP